MFAVVVVVVVEAVVVVVVVVEVVVVVVVDMKVPSGMLLQWADALLSASARWRMRCRKAASALG